MGFVNPRGKFIFIAPIPWSNNRKYLENDWRYRKKSPFLKMRKEQGYPSVVLDSPYLPLFPRYERSKRKLSYFYIRFFGVFINVFYAHHFV